MFVKSANYNFKEPNDSLFTVVHYFIYSAFPGAINILALSDVLDGFILMALLSITGNQLNGVKKTLLGDT